MKISHNWLREYVDVDLSAQDLADLLTNTGLEVEDIEKSESVRGGLQGLLIGEIKSVEKHPNADKLVITKTDIGAGEDLQIICGAPNVAEGQKVIVAPVGTTLYPVKGESFKIRKVKIRGEESFGMICSEDEIGLGPNHEGIMVLNGNAEIGKPARDYFNLEEDTIFEIGLTPNRSDAMSHIGVARDIVAAMNALFNADIHLKLPDTSSFKVDNNKLQIEIVVEDPAACPRYSGLTISGVTVGPSPTWMQSRLQSVGLRPINNIVDITNYVLHEYGQPLHAFDADKIVGNKVIVKQLPQGSKFVTLDKVERYLTSEDLMICNAEEGMCIAGVFGGLKSGVTETTTNVFLESAYFNPVSIRRTSTRHQLKTDAATHYEKGTDPSMTVEILKRTAMLIKDICGGEFSAEIKDIYPHKIDNRPLSLSLKKLEKISGVAIEGSKIKQILNNLDINVKDEKGDIWELEIPTYRTDVDRDQDVMEEILRIYGYNKIPIPLKLNSSIVSGGSGSHRYEKTIANLLRANGFHEIFTNSISKSDHYEKEELKDAVILENSMTAQLDMLRKDMVFGGLEVIAYNLNRQLSQVKLFEFGKTYHRSGSGFMEKGKLAIFISGNIFNESWIAEEKNTDYYYLKGLIDAIIAQFGIEGWKVSTLKKDPYLSEGVSYSVEGDRNILKFGTLDRSFLKKQGIKAEITYGELNWDILLEKNSYKKVTFSGIPKFPYIRRDLALKIDEDVRFEEIENLARKFGKNILREVNLFDVYRGKNMEKGKKSYAVSYVFQDPEKTLTDEEVDSIMESMISQYRDELNAEIR